MGPEARREYLEKVRALYGRMNRSGRGQLLDEVCRMLGCHRKHAVRLMKPTVRVPGRRPGPKPRYGPAETAALEAIWKAADQPCGRRLVADLPLWLPSYARREKLPATLCRRLLTLSAATADRLLRPVRLRHRPKGLGGTRPGSLLKTQIPIRGQCWDETRAGYIEADTVAHGGTSMAGDFLWSLTFTDIATGWTVNRVVWNKGAQGVLDRVRELEGELPFALLGMDCDNGSEFLTHHLWRYLRDRPRPVDFTRGRPYFKNDQAHVEQKNWTHVRQLLGYDRLEHIELVEPINELYRLWGTFHNLFRTCFKLKDKQRVGSRIRKRYETPRTPAQRVLTSAEVSAERKRLIKRELREVDPFELKGHIETQLRRVFEIKRRLNPHSELTLQPGYPPQPAQVPFGNIFP
jgi:hypothetical protein